MYSIKEKGEQDCNNKYTAWPLILQKRRIPVIEGEAEGVNEENNSTGDEERTICGAEDVACSSEVMGREDVTCGDTGGVVDTAGVMSGIRSVVLSPLPIASDDVVMDISTLADISGTTVAVDVSTDVSFVAVQR